MYKKWPKAECSKQQDSPGSWGVGGGAQSEEHLRRLRPGSDSRGRHFRGWVGVVKQVA